MKTSTAASVARWYALALASLFVISFNLYVTWEISECRLEEPFDISSQEENECLGTPVASVLQMEDLELSCIDFAAQPKPAMEQVFGYLGQIQLANAIDLAGEIKEKQENLRITLGAGPSTTKIPNGILTDIPVVDLLNATKLAALFLPGTVKTFVASHVWEHFTYPEAIKAFQNVRCLLEPEGVFRLAVPDAYNVHTKYRKEKVLEGFPNGTFKAKTPYPGHRALWTEPKLAATASIVGFDVFPLEWFTSSHRYCQVDYDIGTHGRIGRSMRYAPKNATLPYFSTSLIADLTPQRDFLSPSVGFDF